MKFFCLQAASTFYYVPTNGGRHLLFHTISFPSLGCFEACFRELKYGELIERVRRELVDRYGPQKSFFGEIVLLGLFIVSGLSGELAIAEFQKVTSFANRCRRKKVCWLPVHRSKYTNHYISLYT